MSRSSDVIALGVLGTVKDLRALLDHLASGSGERRGDAVRAAAAILGRATMEDLAWLEQNRASGTEYGPWASLRPADLGAPPLLRDSLSAPVVALASMHRNGYVREAAVRLLATRDDGDEVPYLLLRTNDWVAEVRAASAEAIRARLVASYSKHFIPCLGILDGLRASRRAALSGLAGDIELCVCDEAVRGALVPALHAPSRSLRRAAARVLALSGDAALVLRAATARDPAVARIGARAVAATWSPGALREVLPVLWRGPPEVRWIALAAMCDRLPREAEPYLREALLDPSTSVRELARYRWEKVQLPPLDFAAHYRAALSAPGDLRQAVSPVTSGDRAAAPGRRSTAGRALAVVVRGLGETGAAADGPLLEPFLHHASALVRTAAVSGLGRFGDARHHEALVLAMDDPSSRVAAEARRWVKLRLGRAAVRRIKP